MKKFKFYALAFAAIAFAGCSDDVIDGQGGNTGTVGDGTPAYLTVSFNTNASSSRASVDDNTGDWDGDAEDSEHSNTGTTEENTVNTALIVVAPTDGTSSGFAQYYSTVDDIKDGNNYGVNSIKVEVGKYNVLVVINPASSIFKLTEGADETKLAQGVSSGSVAKNLYDAIISHNYSYTSSTNDDYINAAASIGPGLGDSPKASFMMANQEKEEVELTEANASPADAATVVVEAERVLSKITFRPNTNLENNADGSKDNIYKVSVPIGTTITAKVVEGVLSDNQTTIVKLNEAKDAYSPASQAHTVYAYYTETDGVREFKGVYGLDAEAGQVTIEDKQYSVYKRLAPKAQADYTGTDDYVAKEIDTQTGFSLADEEGSLTLVPSESQEETKTWYVRLEGYALVNLSKKVNYVRHIGTSATEDISVTNAFGTLNSTNNYLLTPDWKDKNAVAFDEETGAFVGSPAIGTWFYNTLAEVSTESGTIVPIGGNATTPGTINWDDLKYYKQLPTVDDGNQDVDGSGPQHGNPLEGIGKFMAYCFENSTIENHQVHGLSTGISFLARIYTNEECTTPIGKLYMYADHNFESIADIVEAYDGNVSSAILALANKEATNPTQITKEELDAAGITQYEGNVCYYYTTEIKHFDDQNNDNLGNMEFAIMRNNIYSLSVSNITKIGDPIVDPTPNVENESKQTYLDVQVNILPWIVRYNDIEF